MKLKKIASLMLAGVMAVSMLTACNGSTTNDNTNGDDNTNTTPAATYSSTFGDALEGVAGVNGKIVMSDNADLTADLNKAIEKLSAATIMRFYSDLNQITYDRTVYNFGQNSKIATGYGDLIAIAQDMDGRTVSKAFSSDKDMLGDFKSDKYYEDKTVTMLFAVDSTVSASAAVAEVASDLQDEIAALKIENTDNKNNTLHFNYDGSVSVATKTLTENHGMGMHIIAVQITRTATARV